MELTANTSNSGNWIDVHWLTSWVRGEQDNPIDNQELLCQRHSKIDPRKTYRMKLIPKQAWKFLHSQYGGGPEYTTDDCCAECAIEISDGLFLIKF
jgi:hypothetical protein